MNTVFDIQTIAAGPRRRHEARVRRFSVDPELLLLLDTWAVDEHGAVAVVASVCREFDIPEPRLMFHGRRSPYTAQTEAPRRFLVDRYSETEIVRAEQHRGRVIEPEGVVRLGRTTTLMTIAHELGHLLVFVLDPSGTPAHGKVWVSRFDEAAHSIDMFSSAGSAS